MQEANEPTVTIQGKNFFLYASGYDNTFGMHKSRSDFALDFANMGPGVGGAIFSPIRAPIASTSPTPSIPVPTVNGSASSISPSDGGGSKSNSLGLYIVGAVALVLVIVTGWVYVAIRRRKQEAAEQTSAAKANRNAAHPTTALGPLEPGQEVGPTELNQSSVVVEAELLLPIHGV
jgi:hypothetical protein